MQNASFLTQNPSFSLERARAAGGEDGGSGGEQQREAGGRQVTGLDLVHLGHDGVPCVVVQARVLVQHPVLHLADAGEVFRGARAGALGCLHEWEADAAVARREEAVGEHAAEGGAGAEEGELLAVHGGWWLLSAC